jgi:methanogenic corrinoid protein MtbC1
LGVDVDQARIVEKVEEVKPEFVGFSTLLSTTFDITKDTIEMLEKKGLRKQLKVMVGGGIVTDLVKEYTGADFETRDAMDGVRYCLENVTK